MVSCYSHVMHSPILLSMHSGYLWCISFTLALLNLRLIPCSLSTHTVPVPPINITSLSTSDSINLTWATVPSSFQEHFRVHYFDVTNSTSVEEITTAMDTIELIDLKPGHTYNISLQAVSHSWSSEAAAISVTTGL